MKLFKLTVELRYPQQKPDIFSFREKIISSVAKGDKQIPPNISDSLQFLIKEKLIKVVVESKRAGADMILPENIPNPERYALDNINKLFRQLNNVVDFQSFERIGVRGLWIHKVELSMSDLTQRFKDKFYKNNEIVNMSTDIALVFTLKEKDRIVNYNAGPMDKDQVSLMLNQEAKQNGYDKIEMINTSAVFFDYDYYVVKSFKYNDNFLSSFLTEGISNSKENIKKTLDILEIK